MQDILDYLLSVEIIGNNLVTWAVAAIGASITWVALAALRTRLSRDCGGRPLMIAQLTARVARATQGFFIAAATLAALLYLLDLPPKIAGIASAVVTVGVMLQIAIWCTTLLEHWITYSVVRRAANDPGSASAAQIIKFLGQAAIWSTLLLLTLGNFGINITGLVAGLGIGGIAIAFALQSILKDLFASLAIVLDKPFVVGDFIIFGDQLGSVERIGLKTTRIRSLWGEQITVANDDLLNTRVRNYKRMEERRVSFNVSVLYETPVQKLEAIPAWIRSTIDGIPNTRFDRSHVAAFDANGPRIETVYYVLSPDYNIYMDIQQSINLSIARRFSGQGIHFAYPTRRLIDGGGTEAGSQATADARRAGQAPR